MAEVADLTGRRFGRLVVIEKAPRLSYSAAWRVGCDCGVTTVAPTGGLRHGHYTSCGCAHVTRDAIIPPLVDGAKWIPLTKGKFALVDDADFYTLALHSWCAMPGGHTFYACRTVRSEGRKRSLVKMHRLLLGHVDGFVDHINGDGLDNRRSNLRVCASGENRRNSHKPRITTTSRFKGVYCFNCAWTAQIGSHGDNIYLGTFPTEEAAAHAYDDAARRLHGEFARVNFPGPREQGAIA